MATKKQIKAVGYARRSTDLQERSIPDQKAYVEKWAGENGYRIIRWYVDDAISGTSTRGRKAFEQMIAAAENGRDFETIICYDISRFSRGGTNETGYFLHRLQMAGVQTIFCADGIPEGDEGELIQGVKSWQAKQYTVKLSKDVIRGYISCVNIRRSAVGGIAPFGYDKQHQTASGQVLRTFRWLPDGRKQEFSPDGKLVRILEKSEFVKKAKSDIVRLVPSTPERVEAVKRMFRLYLAGHGATYIAIQLNRDGIQSYTGATWSGSHIRGLMDNPVYKGAVVWNRRTIGRFHGVDGQGNLRPKSRQYCKENAKEDWFLVEDVHEPLVSPEDFDRVQQEKTRRKYMYGDAKNKSRALLSSLIVCGHCKNHYHKIYSTYNNNGKSIKYWYYADAGYKRGGRTVCKPTNIPLEILDRWVLEQVKRFLLGDSKTVEQAIKAFIKKVGCGKEKADNAGIVEKELDAVNRRIKATAAMLADLSFDGLDEIKNTLSTLKTRRDALEQKLKTPKTSVRAAFKESDLRDWAYGQITAIDELLANPTATIEARQLLQAIIHRIEIDPFRKEGILFLHKDVYECFQNSFCTWGTHEDFRAALRVKGEA